MSAPVKVFTNSLMAYVSAFILTTIIHESGHFLAYRVLGESAVIYHNYVQVQAQNLSLQIKVIAALAGPVISLVQGIIFALIVIKRRKNNAGDLMILWLSLLGFINFFGYLMLTPLSTDGDTGKVAELLHMPYFLRITIALIGIAILIIVILRIGKYFSAFIPQGKEIVERRKYINSLIIFPIVAGSLINVLLALPVPVFLSIIYPATSSYVILSAYGVILKAGVTPASASLIESKISLHLVLLLLFGILLNRLFTPGIG